MGLNRYVGFFLLLGCTAMDAKCFNADFTSAQTLLCVMCRTPILSVAMEDESSCSLDIGDDKAIDVATNTLLSAGELQGWRWLDGGGPETNVTECLSHLLKYMPRRDMLSLFSDPFDGMTFLLSTVREALSVRQTPLASQLPWDIFKDYVLPYSVLDEKLDFKFQWRSRLHRALSQDIEKAGTNITDALYRLVDAVPSIYPQGVLANESGLIRGREFRWKSETAPAFLSPEEVLRYGGSCTGTGILLVKAARAVGLAARLAGCSESIVANDDHHWVEFYLPAFKSPFGDVWHTREGVSVGNKQGPWDNPSAPMSGCLQGVSPGDDLHTIWATKWSSEVFLPTLWHQGQKAEYWGFIGGENRCGSYCSSWGCGVNRTSHYKQEECEPKYKKIEKDSQRTRRVKPRYGQFYK